MADGEIKRVNTTEAHQASANTSLTDDDKYYISPAAEKKLLRRLDLFTAPVLIAMYFSSFLDRVNIGNAAAAGMPQDIGLTGNQLGVAVSLFYVTYLLCEIPLSIALKKVQPRRFLTAIAIAWSIISIFTGFVQNYSGLIAIRLVLGIFEAGMFPALNLYLTMIYNRKELAFRVSLIFIASGLAGSFGGLLSYGVIGGLNGAGGFAGWRWLFIIEGLISLVLVLVPWILVPADMNTAWWLTEEDRQTHLKRIEAIRPYHGPDKLVWRDVFAAFKDWKVYVSGFCQLAGAGALYGYSTFLPSILLGLGYNTLQAQYLTIPPYLLGSICCCAVSFLSDRVKIKSIFLMGAACFTSTGYIILIASTNNSAKYAAVYLVAMGLYIAPGLNLAWLGANTAPHYKRACAIGFNQTFANLGKLVIASFINVFRRGNCWTNLHGN